MDCCAELCETGFYVYLLKFSDRATNLASPAKPRRTLHPLRVAIGIALIVRGVVMNIAHSVFFT